jgi:N-acetylmuramoyl-L-alanine amidase
MKTVIIDPGHGMSNRRAGTFDPGAVSGNVQECDIVMDWANELRAILQASGVRVIRTRVDHNDPAPVGQRAAIAKRYNGDIMISLHCNAANGIANGTETFYRGEANKGFAARLNLAVVNALETRNRGVKTESSSQHARLAVMAFQPTFLIELGFIDHAEDRAKMIDPAMRKAGCKAISAAILAG